MLRAQIQLTEVQHRLLRAAARREGVSVAEMVRRCVDNFFEDGLPRRSELYARAGGLVGRFEDPARAADLSTHHDGYLDEAIQ